TLALEQSITSQGVFRQSRRIPARKNRARKGRARMSTWASRGFVCALAALPVVAAAAPFRELRTEGWRARVPADWRLEKSLQTGGDASIGRWVARSPNGGFVLRVNISAGARGDFAKLARDDYARLRERISDPEIVKKEELRADGRDVAYVVLKAKMARRDFMKDYLVFRLTTRTKDHAKLVAVTVAATEEKLEG